MSKRWLLKTPSLCLKKLLLTELTTQERSLTRSQGKPAFENVTATESSATVKRLEKWFKQIYYEEN